MRGPVMRMLRRYFFAGLVVIAPVTITAFVLWWIFQRLDGLLGRFLYPALGIRIPGLGLLLLLALLIIIGWAATRAVGVRALAWWNVMLERFPLTRRVYSASNRIVRTVFGGERRVFREVVLVEYPSNGRWSVGFLTGSEAETEWMGRDDAVAVFVPTSPNPTTGWVVVVPRDRVIPLPMTLDEAFTYVLSAGTVSPPSPAMRTAGGPDPSGRDERSA